MEYLNLLGKNAKSAFKQLNNLTQTETDDALREIGNALIENGEYIISENEKDVLNAIERGVKPSLIDRLRLTENRLADMKTGLFQVAELTSPLYETIYSFVKENGLKIEEKRVPFGVIGIIFESRPNVVADAFSLCFKTHNAVILRGGSDAINSNKAIVKIIRKTLMKCGICQDAVQLIENTSREVATEFMKLNEFVDLLIPRGGAGLIKSVVENSTVPVIETGTGNCHIYVDKSADIDMAVEIIFNAKTQRYGVCNACESLVIHSEIIDKVLPKIKAKLDEKQVEIRGDERACKACDGLAIATDEDFYTEYLDAIISVKTVDDYEQAIEHINKHNTGHSEAVIAQDEIVQTAFMNDVDAAAVYVNASTRFTDGFEYGLGAEIGISTQKLHARGPMGLKALTTTKFYCFGNGQTR